MQRTNALTDASPADLRRELARRLHRALAGLAGQARWNAADWIFAAVVAVLALSSAGFFTATYRIVAADPDYFSRRLIAGMGEGGLDPIETGGIVAAAEAAAPDQDAAAMPVPTIRRGHEPEPGDYQLVMVFRDEAFLSTARELLRAKVGSILPGLGTVTAMDAATRSLRTERAVLTMTAP